VPYVHPTGLTGVLPTGSPVGSSDRRIRDTASDGVKAQERERHGRLVEVELATLQRAPRGSREISS